jgi:AcrR family transcriptional regulator
MSDIAEEAGLSMGGLYRYFENKTMLFEALIGDIHEELYQSSRARVARFRDRPFDALLEANTGYLSHYHSNRDVMRAFFEAAAVDEGFRRIWWGMRDRHADRFAKVLAKDFGITEIEGVDARIVADAMACMVEQCAYVWYAREDMNDHTVSVETAALVTTRTWFRAFFPAVDEPSAGEAVSPHTARPAA